MKKAKEEEEEEEEEVGEGWEIKKKKNGDVGARTEGRKWEATRSELYLSVCMPNKVLLLWI